MHIWLKYQLEKQVQISVNQVVREKELLYWLQIQTITFSVTCPNGYTPLGQTCYKIGRCADWPTAERRCKADQQGFLYKAESETFQHMKNILMGRGKILVPCSTLWTVAGSNSAVGRNSFVWTTNSHKILFYFLNIVCGVVTFVALFWDTNGIF